MFYLLCSIWYFFLILTSYFKKAEGKKYTSQKRCLCYYVPTTHWLLIKPPQPRLCEKLSPLIKAINDNALYTTQYWQLLRDSLCRRSVTRNYFLSLTNFSPLLAISPVLIKCACEFTFAYKVKAQLNDVIF